ncbi:MAG TPA: addiction module toxin RelE [Rhodospirillaceae bacterium]|nr:addiction module toxin RelE [Rhodospirillaceae bacterium]
MKVVQTATFSRAVKKLHSNQKKELDAAVNLVMADTSIGEKKAGDLAGVLVYKFKMLKQLMLLAYTYEEEVLTLTLLALGTHENFYRDIKRSS